MTDELSYEERVRNHTLSELEDVIHHIDRASYPERYDLVMAEIEKRKQQPDIKKEEKLSPSLYPQKERKLRSVYAGFWIRFLARTIDAIIYMLPFFTVISWIYARVSRELYFTVSLFCSILVCGYFIYLHGRWGQTFGKMVTGIKVVRISGESIDYKTAALRNIVDIGSSILYTILTLAALTTIPDIKWIKLTASTRSMTLLHTFPTFHTILTCALSLWVFANVISILLTKKKRALHDFIAGTMVIYPKRLRETEKE